MITLSVKTTVHCLKSLMQAVEMFEAAWFLEMFCYVQLRNIICHVVVVVVDLFTSIN